MTNFLTKVAQTFGNFLGHFEKNNFKYKLLSLFLGNLAKELGNFLF